MLNDLYFIDKYSKRKQYSDVKISTNWKAKLWRFQSLSLQRTFINFLVPLKKQPKKNIIRSHALEVIIYFCWINTSDSHVRCWFTSQVFITQRLCGPFVRIQRSSAKGNCWCWFTWHLFPAAASPALVVLITFVWPIICWECLYNFTLSWPGLPWGRDC